MSDGEQSRGWWQTLPGVITSVAAAITALAGLIVAIDQTGWLDPGRSPPATPPAPPATTPSPPAATAPQDQAAATDAAAARTAHAVGLPALRDYRLGEATYTLLGAELSPRTTEKDALQIRVRMTNHDRFDSNFWDQSFRLTVDGQPLAPESGLNELVPAESAKEGEVLFAIPHGTTDATLRITYADESTEIPLALAPPG